MKKALVVVDVQMEYFPAGLYLQWDVERALDKTTKAIQHFREKGDLVIVVQHIAGQESPIFNPSGTGIDIHPAVLAETVDAPIIVKAHADSFLNTNLNDVLQEHSIDSIVVCGIMTQNCVTHTAISSSAANYQVQVLAEACTAPDEMVHNIALAALNDRVELISLNQL